MAKVKYNVTQEALQELWQSGLTDREMADRLGCSGDLIRHLRLKYGFEPNSTTSGPLGAKIHEFIDVYHEIIMNHEPDSPEMIHLCENCTLEDCCDCYNIARKRIKKAA